MEPNESIDIGRGRSIEVNTGYGGAWKWRKKGKISEFSKQVGKVCRGQRNVNVFYTPNDGKY